ncbi:histidine phosphotransferase hpt1p [Fusarium albosuccineum]|uniref:Histidine phosphotransferase hpt1p n=1 Tax=Fusarium albosuccineum TaxID=1237068 RepID=A0A8H4L7B4_9HYPO|nr:histidine phosphotransferase hpt1p [Fusarium albosuccineum]
MEFILQSDAIDVETFQQILEMDDEGDEQEFSRSIVYGFFDQAENTLRDMEQALEKEDLAMLGALGKFLKGSAATLGAIKVHDDAQKIEYYGKGRDSDGETYLEEDVCLDRVRDTLPTLKTNYAEVKTVLRKFYRDEGGDGDLDD